MNDLQRIHARKIQRRKRDIKARKNGKRAAVGFCLAKSVDPEVFKQPLDLSRVQIPVGYED